MDNETKRELLRYLDQIEMAEASGDAARLDAVLDLIEPRLDAIERSLGVAETRVGAASASRAAGFQTRLGALRNGLW